MGGVQSTRVGAGGGAGGAGPANSLAFSTQLSKECLKQYLKKFDSDEVEVLKKVYKALSARSPGPGIDKETFLQYFPLPGLWGERLFQKFDFKGSGSVDYEEFLIGIAVCCRGTKSDRMYVLFQVFDLNSDGYIQKSELVAMLSNLPNLDRYMSIRKAQQAHSEGSNSVGRGSHGGKEEEQNLFSPQCQRTPQNGGSSGTAGAVSSSPGNLDDEDDEEDTGSCGSNSNFPGAQAQGAYPEAALVCVSDFVPSQQYVATGSGLSLDSTSSNERPRERLKPYEPHPLLARLEQEASSSEGYGRSFDEESSGASSYSSLSDVFQCFSPFDHASRNPSPPRRVSAQQPTHVGPEAPGQEAPGTVSSPTGEQTGAPPAALSSRPSIDSLVSASSPAGGSPVVLPPPVDRPAGAGTGAEFPLLQASPHARPAVGDDGDSSAGPAGGASGESAAKGAEKSPKTGTLSQQPRGGITKTASRFTSAIKRTFSTQSSSTQGAPESPPVRGFSGGGGSRPVSVLPSRQSSEASVICPQGGISPVGSAHANAPPPGSGTPAPPPIVPTSSGGVPAPGGVSPPPQVPPVVVRAASPRAETQENETGLEELGEGATPGGDAGREASQKAFAAGTGRGSGPLEEDEAQGNGMLEVPQAAQPSKGPTKSAMLLQAEKDKTRQEQAKKNPSPVAQSLIKEEKEENEQKDVLDVEGIVDKIIEECEFFEHGKLSFPEFKTWLERNEGILSMFTECLHEEVWGLQGNALYRSTSVQNRPSRLTAAGLQGIFKDPLGSGREGGSGKVFRRSKLLSSRTSSASFSSRGMGKAGSPSSSRVGGFGYSASGGMIVNMQHFQKVKHLFTNPAHSSPRRPTRDLDPATPAPQPSRLSSSPQMQATGSSGAASAAAGASSVSAGGPVARGSGAQFGGAGPENAGALAVASPVSGAPSLAVGGATPLAGTTPPPAMETTSQASQHQTGPSGPSSPPGTPASVVSPAAGAGPISVPVSPSVTAVATAAVTQVAGAPTSSAGVEPKQEVTVSVSVVTVAGGGAGSETQPAMASVASGSSPAAPGVTGVTEAVAVASVPGTPTTGATTAVGGPVSEGPATTPSITLQVTTTLDPTTAGAAAGAAAAAATAAAAAFVEETRAAGGATAPGTSVTHTATATAVQGPPDGRGSAGDKVVSEEAFPVIGEEEGERMSGSGDARDDDVYERIAGYRHWEQSRMSPQLAVDIVSKELVDFIRSSHQSLHSAELPRDSRPAPSRGALSGASGPGSGALASPSEGASARAQLPYREGELRQADLAAIARAHDDPLACSGHSPRDLYSCPNCCNPLLLCPFCHSRYPQLTLLEGRVVMECRQCGRLGGSSSSLSDAGAQPAAGTGANSGAGGASGSADPSGGPGAEEDRVEAGICVGGSSRVFTRCWHCGWELSKCAEMLKGNSEAAIDGVLYKKGKHLHQWQARYYVLVDNMLYYYRRKGDAKPRGFMFLEGCYVELLSEQVGGRQYGFAIVHPKGETVSKRLLFANSAKEQREWVDTLRVATKQQALEQLYQVGEQLGHGKFSIVYKGIHRATNELYAIKVIDKGKINGHERELLRSEMAILRLLNHPNVIYMKELLDTKETLYIVMELVRGGELFDLIQQNHRLPELHVNRIISQLLSTVYYLHKCGIVHRDLKPENILLTDRTPNATIKLTDFGLSTLCAPNEVLHQPCGTLAYVAPEVLTMEGYNHQVDVWSIGVIMYLLLRGRLPFPINQAFGHPSFYENTPVSFDGAVWREVSSSAKDLIVRMLQPNPRRRITVADALQHIWIKNPTAVVNNGSKNIDVYISQLDEVRHSTRYGEERTMACCPEVPTFTIPKNGAKPLQNHGAPVATAGPPAALRPPVSQLPAAPAVASRAPAASSPSSLPTPIRPFSESTPVYAVPAASAPGVSLSGGGGLDPGAPTSVATPVAVSISSAPPAARTEGDTGPVEGAAVSPSSLPAGSLDEVPESGASLGGESVNDAAPVAGRGEVDLTRGQRQGSTASGVAAASPASLLNLTLQDGSEGRRMTSATPPVAAEAGSPGVSGALLSPAAGSKSVPSPSVASPAGVAPSLAAPGCSDLSSASSGTQRRGTEEPEAEPARQDERACGTPAEVPAGSPGGPSPSIEEVHK
ncbi:calcium dependent protein kinase CDPK7 [Toxoplasma gondii ARI]|uniref:non-specific serine/threonine protein kinase n=1 Tax=Toxoplasma gondii ARI TaxID=1074872 RepID=A0A139XXJ4_TOXGO|nr:calcium dependent protein kinase CDPK7 [Toxoplasma gondii ARI]